MRSDAPRAPLGLTLAAGAGLLFLLLPLALIFLYAFTTDERSYTFPPPGLTTKWFAVAWGREDVWQALGLSVRVAAVATLLALVLGTLCAAAMVRARFFGREAISLLVILPIALPGIITGISLRSAFSLLDVPFSTWTIVLGHATFCIVVVYNNAVARFRRLSGSLMEASADLGANAFQTFRHVILPNLGTALLAGGMLAFALSFDEVIVTTFTAGQQATLPIWMLEELVRPRQRPVTNVVAMVVVLVTFLPILAAYYLTREGSRPRGRGVDSARQDRLHRRGAPVPREDGMQTEMLIGGAFAAGENSPETVLNPRTGAAIAEVPGGLRGAGRGRRRRGPRRLRGLVAHHAGRALGGAPAASPTASRPRPTASPALEALNCGKPINAMKGDEIPAIADCWRFFAGAVRCQHGAIAGEYLAGPHLDDPPRPGRGRGLDRALELSADDDGLEARPGGRRRQHRRLQALGDDAAQRAEARRDPRRGAARRGGQRRHRPRRQRRERARQPPRGRHDLADRRHRHRQEDAAGGRHDA